MRVEDHVGTFRGASGPGSAGSPAPGAVPMPADRVAAPAAAVTVGAPAEPPGASGAGPASAPSRRPWLERVPGYTVPLLLVGIPLLVALAAAVAPGAVGDGIVWKYYWGPIQADADGHETEFQHGIEAHSGYNLVNTISWAALLGVCLLGTAQLLARRNASMDSRLILGAVLWVVAGSIFHVLEDVGLFLQPTQFFFITPPIYLGFAALGVLSFVLGHHLKGVAERAGLDRALQKLWLVIAIPVVGYLWLWMQPQWTQVTVYIHPVLVAVFGLVAYAGAAWRFRRLGRIEPNELVSFLAVGWLLLALAYVATYIVHPWPQCNGGPCRDLVPHHVLAALWAPVLAVAVASIVAIVARGRAQALAPSDPTTASKWLAYAMPVNVLLLFSQLLDGFATSIGIDIGRVYTEKHVLSGGIIEWTRKLGESLALGPVAHYPTFFGFLPVKLLVSLLVIYAIDVSNPRDAERYPNVIGLVKFAIIMVGLGPGIRDFLRMSLGV